MESLEPKKLSPIRILQILQRETDPDHPMTQSQIAARLERDYGLVVERKAVGRAVALLADAGYDIVTTQKGCYMAARLFEDSELHLLIDSVLQSKHIAPRHSRDLIDKLCSLTSRHFRRFVRHIYSVDDWNKTENNTLFYSIQQIDEAIEAGSRVRFDYNKYRADKQLHRSAVHTVTPYQMILHNQRYYLMGYNEKWQHLRFYRLDRITDLQPAEGPVTPLRAVPGYERGIDYRRLSSALPYMYSDQPVPVEFLTDGRTLDQVIDWFGRDITILRQEDRYRVRLQVSPMAMEHWAMQYATAVEVLSPPDLRERIGIKLAQAAEKYGR